MAKENSVGGSVSIGRRILAGTNWVVYTIVGLTIVVLCNWFIDRHDHHWDLTSTKKYSLSPQSTKLLKGLERDVTLYVFDRPAGFRERRDLLNLYSSASHRVSVHYVDPNREPSLAKEFGVRTYGTVVVASGDRHFEAPSATEEGVSNALIRVLKGQSIVYFVQGHGERDLEGSDRSGYEKVKKELENENNQVKTLVLLQKLEIPSDCALLVIAGPRNDYLPQEVETIKKYLNGGGRAMFLLDPGVELPNLAKFLEDWNVTVRNDLVIDENPVARVFGTSPSMPLIIKYGSSPIVQPLQRMATLFPLSRSFSVGKDYKAGVTADSLCETSPDSFSVTDFSPKMRQVAYRPGKDVKGPLTVAVSVALSGEGENKTRGRFVAVGTSLLAANAYLGFQGNRDLFMNMVDWLSANENLISIRPKPPESQHLNLTARQMNGILLKVMAVPLIIIVAGIWVWWGRR